MKTSPNNRSRGAAWLGLALGIVSFASNANAAILFQDNFSGDSLDSSKWIENDTYAWNYSSLQVDNGIATFSYRPIITTTQSFSGSINITGSFSLGDWNQSENLQFVTRSDSNTYGRWSEPGGLKFSFNNSGVSITFLDTSGNYTAVAPLTTYALENNQTYAFSIIDAGNQATVSIDGTTILSTALDPSLGGGQGYFAIANRERAAGTQVGPITISSISAVPEPSSQLALIALGSAGVLTRRRLKRKA